MGNRMSPDSLKKLIHASPWSPFTLQLADGRALRVPHPDFITLTRSGRTAIVISDKNDDEFEIVDVFLILGAKAKRASKAAK